MVAEVQYSSVVTQYAESNTKCEHCVSSFSVNSTSLLGILMCLIHSHWVYVLIEVVHEHNESHH